MSALKTIEKGQPGLYVLGWPLPGDHSLPKVDYRRGFAVPVISRQGGVLLAVPLDFLPQEALVAGLNASADTVLGPSMTVEVPAVEEDDAGEEVETEISVPVLLVDFLWDVGRGLTEFDPGSRTSEIQHFLPDAPDLLPSSSSLLNAALEWSHTEVDTRVHFYSAEEEVPHLEAETPKRPTPKRSAAPLPALPMAANPKETPRPKKVTTAALADQVASLAASIPALLDQVQQISEQQKKMEENQQLARTPAYRQPFGTPTPVDKDGLRTFVSMVGAAPAGRGTPLLNTPKPSALPEEPRLAPHEEGFPIMGEGGTEVTTALAQQTQAMTALVAHLVGQSDLSDLAAGSSSSALTSKGSTKREKLQNDLAERKSTFLLQVAQLAMRRMKPSEPPPSSLAELQHKSTFTKYLTKHGGYAGQRELGYMAWLVAHIADCLVAGDNKGAQEITALTLCALDQACQDGNRWDVAFLIALLEEPPPGVFASRGGGANPRMKAFSPLIPQSWATTTLSYVREMDLIASRRQEAGGARVKKEEDKEEPAPKRRPRYPKKPKGGGETS